MIGVEAAGRRHRDRRALPPRITGGRPGVLHGNRTYLLQDDDGQIMEAHSISAGLDYPGIGPEHAWLQRHRPGRTTSRSPTTRRSRPSSCCSRSSKASSRRSSRRTRWPTSAKIAPTLPQGPHHRHESVRPRRQGHLHRRRRAGDRAVSAPTHGDRRIDAPLRRARRPRAAAASSPSSRPAIPTRHLAARSCAGLPAAGADLIELGMPFSDPMADGPAIQASSLRALARRHDAAPDARAWCAASAPATATTPIVLMGYYNPIYAYGVDALPGRRQGRPASTG